VLEFHAKASQAIASEGLVQGAYVVARMGFKPTTLRIKGDESTDEPPRPTIIIVTMKARTKMMKTHIFLARSFCTSKGREQQMLQCLANKHSYNQNMNSIKN